MPEQVLKNVGIWIDGRNMAGVSNSVGITLEAEAPESTSFADEWRTRSEGGLKTAGLSLEGWYDRGEIDRAQFNSIGEDGSAMIAPAGQTAGPVAYVVPFRRQRIRARGQRGRADGLHVCRGGRRRAGPGPGGRRAGRCVVGRYHDAAEPRGDSHRRDAGSLGAHHPESRAEYRFELESATTGTTTFITTRDVEAGINSTRLHKFSVLGPITDEWWQLKYDFNVG